MNVLKRLMAVTGLFLVIGLGLVEACRVKKCSLSTPADEFSKAPPISLIKDPGFRNGLYLKGAVSGAPSAGESLYPFGSDGHQSVWELAEWNSRHLLHQSLLNDKDGMKLYENKAKRVSFEQKGNEIVVRLDVNASVEYDHPRKSNEPWTHLLVEQDFIEKPLLKDIDKLTLFFDGRLIQCVSAMPEGTFDPGLHTAQFQLFLVIQDRNPQSIKLGDFLWFGVPFYDYRFRKASVYAAQDIGKDDATGKFIYSLGTDDFMQGSFHDKEWIKIEKNLKPFIMEAISVAKERGYLSGSAIEDMGISGMNLGWEVPGIFDAGFEFKRFDLKYSAVSN